MLPPVHLPFQPSSHDCLAWSPDGELAVAAGEEVYLLIPQHGGLEAWTHLRITVSSFTFREWPWQEPASFKDMSIGEEQARATVTALAWSPAGLATHRRSVLAVLTSNLILSFWASNSNPTDVGSWERVLVVNKALRPGSRLQQRIRSMAWAPTNPQYTDRYTPFSRKKSGIHLIAIADDNNGLCVLRASGPITGHSSKWVVEVLHRHSVSVSKSSSDRPSLFNHVMNAHHYIDHIEFGTWKGDIPIMYRTSGTVYRASISVCDDPPSHVRPEDSLVPESLAVNLDEEHVIDTKIPLQSTITTPIKTQMAVAKEKFGFDNKIGRQVVLRRWGLASFSNLVAACVTLHPAKMIEYVAPFDGNATIFFDADDKNGDAKSVFPRQNLAEVDVAKAQRAIIDTILDQKLYRPSALKKLDLKLLYTAFCGSLLLSVNDRLQQIQAAVDIMDLMEHHPSLNLDAEHRALLSIKNAPQLTDQELVNVVGEMTKARGQAESKSHTPESFLLDLCPFCPETQSCIHFDNFTEAYCPQGHSFGEFIYPLSYLSLLTSPAARCALTFLPLLEPGTSKRCIYCRREFIDERFHPEIQMRLSERLDPTNIDDSSKDNTGVAPEHAGLAKHSVASVLFDKFDTCPYCGGKFFN